MIAGESSGDVLGGRLMAALAAQSDGPMKFIGVGGDRTSIYEQSSGFHNLIVEFGYSVSDRGPYCHRRAEL